MEKRAHFLVAAMLVSAVLACGLPSTTDISRGEAVDDSAMAGEDPVTTDKERPGSPLGEEPSAAEDEPYDGLQVGVLSPDPEGIQPENVTDITFYATDVGSLLVNGMVENTEPETIDFIFVTVSLFDGEGQLMLEAQGLSVVNPAPGEKVPFTVSFDLRNARGFVTYEIDLDWDNLLTYYNDLEIVTSESTLSEGQGVNISGTARNVGSETAKNVRVAAALFDADNNIISVAFSYPEVGDVPPGGTFEFSIDDWLILPEHFDHYELYVQATLI